MKIALQPPNSQDEFYLIRAEAFFRIVDTSDLAQRNSESIEDAYHEHWLCQSDGDSFAFQAPAFYLQKGTARFINGRHRTLLLRRYLNEFPMALTAMDGYPSYSTQPGLESIQALRAISVRKLTGQETFDFPDLPVKYLGYDHNTGK